MQYPQLTTPFLLGLIAICMLALPGHAGAFKLAAAGDISCPADSTAQHVVEPGNAEPAPAQAKCQGKRVAEMIAAEHPLVTLAIGDLIQGQTSYRNAYNDFTAAWGSLDPRIAASVGNHDYHRNANGVYTASGYFRYWEEQKAPVWSYGKPGDGWSSWNAGKWHLINLNSNCRVTDCTFTGPQLRWLVDDLKADRKNPDTQCTLAYFHHPLFSSGTKAGRSGDASLVVNLWELLYRYRTDLVVTGHQHYYERYLPQNPSGERDDTGITQIITGTGGASTFRINGAENKPAANAAASVRSLGATFLDLEDDSYSTYFRGMLGDIHDPTPATPCLDPDAGAEERAPRSERYAAHMDRMASLDARIIKLDTRITKLKGRIRKSAGRHEKSRKKPRTSRATLKRRMKKWVKARVSVRKTRETVRVKRLY